jgi:hypothetical protein
MGASKKEPPSEAEIFFSTDEITETVRRLAVVATGVKLPVHGEVTWMWSPGKGPVARVVVRHIPNVRMLPIAKAGPRGAG